MKKTRVAFCVRDMQIGGVESVLIQTLDKLLKCKNIELCLITYTNIHEAVYKKYFNEHPEIKVCSLYSFNWLGTTLPRFVLSRIIFHLCRDIYRNIKRFVFGMRKFKNIDVFIDYHDFGFYDELKSLKNVKKIAWFHSSFDLFVKRDFIKKLDVYNNVVVLTDEFIKEFNKLYKNHNDKLVRIYNPIDIKKIQGMALQKLDDSYGDYFCSVTRLAYDKDVTSLLKGFDLFWVSNNKPDLKLVIVGDGKKKREYKNYANSLASSKQIVFVGKKSNPFVYMKNAMANILSSFGEGFALVLIESAAVGTLNIASACRCGPREILLNGRGGLLFEPGNAEQLAKCLSDVYNKKINVDTMIKNATKSLTRFDGDKIAKEIISLIS